jgi:hypothetical protein
VLAAGTPPPVAVPLADGGLQLEWHLPGLELALAIAPDGALGAEATLHDPHLLVRVAALLARPPAAD